jgi:hypothetical protein
VMSYITNKVLKQGSGGAMDAAPRIRRWHQPRRPAGHPGRPARWQRGWPRRPARRSARRRAATAALSRSAEPRACQARPTYSPTCVVMTTSSG